MYNTDDVRIYLTASRSEYSTGFTLSGLLAGFTVSGFVEQLASGTPATMAASIMFMAFLAASIFFILSLLAALIVMMSITRELRDLHFRAQTTVLSEDKYQKLHALGAGQIHYFVPFLLGLFALFVAIGAAGFIYSDTLGVMVSVACMAVMGIAARFGFKLLS